MPIVVGDGIRAAMAANQNDHPVEAPTFTTVRGDAGELITTEEVRGTKARYLASNATGQWETITIPFGEG